VSDTPFEGGGFVSLAAPGTVAEVAAARRTVAAQACRLSPGGEHEACALVLDMLGLLPDGERTIAAARRDEVEAMIAGGRRG
jgi:hypothetical protein